MVLTLNKENFEEKVLNAQGKVLVDFAATWCGPCKMLAPIVDELAEERTDITFGKLDIDECMELAQKYQVASVPTLILFENGEVLRRSIGLIGPDVLEEFIDE